MAVWTVPTEFGMEMNSVHIRVLRVSTAVVRNVVLPKSFDARTIWPDRLVANPGPSERRASC
jgi:hypothetical protein